MPLPLPNLDDRRWDDLVQEGRALVPFYAPEWTDHNASDPGITFLELFAWMAEMDVFRTNQVPEAHRLKFLGLVGVAPRPPRAARTILAFEMAREGTEPPETLPAGLEFVADDPFGQPTRFRLEQPLTVVQAAITAVHVQVGGRSDDITARWKNKVPFAVFGDNPVLRAGETAPGPALVLTFARALPTGVPIRLWFSVDPDLVADAEKRARLVHEMADQAAGCGPADANVHCQYDGSRCGDPRQSPPAGATPPAVWQCGQQMFVSPWALPQPNAGGNRAAEASASAGGALVHHSVRTVWEVEIGQGANGQSLWRRLEPGTEIVDETRAFTLNGGVTLTLPAFLAGSDTPRRLRCRLVGGAFDEAPLLHHLAVNAVPAEQAVVPVAATPAGPDMTSWWVREPGSKDDDPERSVPLPEGPAVAASVGVYTKEGDAWYPWEQRADFDASGRSDRHYVLDASASALRFGDGDRGRVVPQGAPIYLRYLATRAEQGNLQAGRVFRLVDSAANRAHQDLDFPRLMERFRIPNRPTAQPAIMVTNTIAAAGGTGPESTAAAEGRALESVDEVGRAVTLADYEDLAKATPGVRLARAHARANVHTAFPCFLAPGIVSLVILPSLPAGRPRPSVALRRAVAAYVNRRRVIGTRVEVVGPTYTEVTVRAKVRAYAGVSMDGLRVRITAALNAFFDPLTGGPDSLGGGQGSGWPFGRDVYRSEVLQVIDETPGVDHVLALDLASGCSEPQCANLCLGVFGLVAAGEHQIEVVEGARS